MATFLRISLPAPLEIIATPSTGSLSASSYTAVPLTVSTWNYTVVSNSTLPTTGSVDVMDLEVASYDLGRSSEMDPTLFIENREILPYPTDFSFRQIGPGQLDVCIPQHELKIDCSASLLNSFNITSPMAIQTDKPFADYFGSSDLSYIIPTKVAVESIVPIAQLSFDASTFLVTNIIIVSEPAFTLARSISDAKQVSDGILIGIGPTIHEYLPTSDTIRFDSAYFLQSNPSVTEFVAVTSSTTRADSVRPQTSTFVDALHLIGDRGFCSDGISISMQDYFAQDYVDSGYMG
jgi:hypothetical protein